MGFNGIFAFIFGAGMLVVLGESSRPRRSRSPDALHTSGVKPVSAFGLAHSACSVTIRRKLRHEYNFRDGQPIMDNVLGVMAFIKCFVIDLSILEEPGAESSEKPDLSPSAPTQDDDASSGELILLTTQEVRM